MAKDYRNKVDYSGDCHVWIAGRDKDGYGQVKRGGKKWQAHRYVWTQEVGPIPEGLSVLHTCDNPPCVRLEHLWLGTIKENTHDMMRKGRKVARGPAIPADVVARAIELYKAGWSFRAIGREVGWDRVTVTRHIREGVQAGGSSFL